MAIVEIFAPAYADFVLSQKRGNPWSQAQAPLRCSRIWPPGAVPWWRCRPSRCPRPSTAASCPAWKCWMPTARRSTGSTPWSMRWWLRWTGTGCAAAPASWIRCWRAARAWGRCTAFRRRQGHHAGRRHGHDQGIADLREPAVAGRLRGVRAHARRRCALRGTQQFARVRPGRPYLQPGLRDHAQCLRSFAIGRRQQRRGGRGRGAAHAARGRWLGHDGLAAHAGRLQPCLRTAHLGGLRAAWPLGRGVLPAVQRRRPHGARHPRPGPAAVRAGRL